MCNGERGDVPACDHGENSETPDRDAAIIGEAVHQLNAGVLAQFDQNLSSFARDIDELKAETY